MIIKDLGGEAPTGVRLIFLDKVEDNRGFFRRDLDMDELGSAGLRTSFVQVSTAYNPRHGTLRGMHYQAPPFSETKIVMCRQGAIQDVLVDLRLGRNWYLRPFSIVLTPGMAIYVPKQVAHGYLTLGDATEVQYFIDQRYQPTYQRGFRYDDPSVLGLAECWSGVKVRSISQRDLDHPLLDPGNPYK